MGRQRKRTLRAVSREDEHSADSDAAQRKAMGLPVSFGAQPCIQYAEDASEPWEPEAANDSGSGTETGDERGKESFHLLRVSRKKRVRLSHHECEASVLDLGTEAEDTQCNVDLEPLPEPADEGAGRRKFHKQRYDLFHHFDQGIRIDDEGYFSVTPERVAAHIALRGMGPFRRPRLVWDAFAGVGGNVIQYALAGGSHVVATDTCLQRLEMTLHNAAVYGARAYVDCVCADALSFPRMWRRSLPVETRACDTAPFDTAFASPPWGGPNYVRAPVYDAARMLPVPLDPMLAALWAMTRHPCASSQTRSNVLDDATDSTKGSDGERSADVADSAAVVLYLPRSTDLARLAPSLRRMGASVATSERHWLSGREKAIALYLS